MSVRPATEADLPRIAAMRLAFLEQVKSVPVQMQPRVLSEQEEMFRKGMSEGRILLWVDEEDGVVAGSGGLLLSRGGKARGKGREGAELMAVYTLREFRRMGIGSAIVATVLAHAREAGLPSVTLQPTPDSKGIYERFGFVGNDDEMVLSFGSAAGL